MGLRNAEKDSMREELSESESKFFDSLPATFSSNDAVEVASKQGLSRSRAYRLLSKYEGELFAKVERGKYVKIE